MNNRSMPRSTVIPELAYPDIGQAIEWLSDVFEFKLRLRIGNHRAQMNVGDGAVVLVQEHQEESRASVMVRVPDVVAHHERAVSRGAQVFHSTTDFTYGERQYSVVDFAGHSWHFSQSIADIDPAEWVVSL